MRNKEFYIWYKHLVEFLNREICLEEEKNIEEIDAVYIEECRELIFEINEKCKSSEEEFKKRYLYYVMIIKVLYSKNHTD